MIILNVKNITIKVISIIQIYITFSEELSINEKKMKSWIAFRLVKRIPTLFVMFFIFITMLFTTGLIIYHIKLIISNITTKEEIKKLVVKELEHESLNLSNILYIFFTQKKILYYYILLSWFLE